jgi:hypothetical protein
VEGLASAIGIMVTPFPCNYLGMPLSIKKLTKADWQALLDKVDRFLATWKARLMSKAGRLEMLNSVLTSLAVYLMTINEMPAWVRKEFDRRRRAWLWAGETTCNGGKCRVNWKQVCRPKALGGLGVHCIQAFGTALRLRWMWQKWKKPNKPWAHMKLPVTKKDKALFAAATTIKIGNGETANFWSDRWLFDQMPAEIAPDVFKISIRKNRTVKDALTNEKWLLDLRHNLDVQHLPQLLKLAELVEPVQLTNEPDDIMWRFGSKQVYTARSAYMIQFLGAVKTDFTKLAWKGWAPARCKFFIWTLLLNRVLTADKLLQRQWDNEYFCPLCRRNLETATHLFTECQYSLKVWAAMAECFNMNHLNPSCWIGKDLSVHEWYKSLSDNQTKLQRKETFPATKLVCWELWKERNRRIFDKKELPLPAMISRIKEEAAAWRQSGAPLPLVAVYGGTPFDPG